MSDRGRDERAKTSEIGMRKVRVLQWSSEEGAWEAFGSGMTAVQGRNKGTRGGFKERRMMDRQIKARESFSMSRMVH